MARAANQMKAVAVTGLHRGDNPQPGASVIASLRRRFPNIRIVGLSYDPLESSLFARGIDHPDASYLLPYPNVGAGALLERLDAILQKEQLDVIIPCLDSEIRNFLTILPKLRKRGIHCVLPTKKSFDLRCKTNLYDFCRHTDVLSPRTKTAKDPWELEKFAKEIGYPVYVKGKHYEARMVNTARELHEASSDIARVWGWPVLVQEVIFGEEYDVIGLGDGKGNIIKHCAIRKILRTSSGKGFAGIVIEDPELDQIAARITKALKWNGPFEMEFLKAADKPHALFEINPRFPAWVDFPSQIGCNLPGRLLEDLFNIKQEPLRSCTAGQMYVRHCIDLVGDVADLARMASTGETTDNA